MSDASLNGLDVPRLKRMVLDLWRGGGADTLVKVLPRGIPLDDWRTTGYCTSIKFIAGHTPAEMERILGFAPGSKLAGGADIYRVDPLPSSSQFDLRGYTHTPAGKAQVDGIVVNPAFPPGLGAPQWELSGYPRSGLKFLATVLTGQRFVCPYSGLPTALSTFIAST